MCPLCDSECTYYPKSTTRVYSNSPLSTPVCLILLSAFYHDLSFTLLVAFIPCSRTCLLSYVLLMSRLTFHDYARCGIPFSMKWCRAPITAALDLVEYRKEIDTKRVRVVRGNHDSVRRRRVSRCSLWKTRESGTQCNKITGAVAAIVTIPEADVEEAVEPCRFR